MRRDELIQRKPTQKTAQLLSGAISIIIYNQTATTLERFPPEFIVRPDLQSIDAFDFHKIETALRAGDQAIEGLEAEFEAFKAKLS